MCGSHLEVSRKRGSKTGAPAGRTKLGPEAGGILVELVEAFSIFSSFPTLSYLFIFFQTFFYIFLIFFVFLSSADGLDQSLSPWGYMCVSHLEASRKRGSKTRRTAGRIKLGPEAGGVLSNFLKLFRFVSLF